MLASAKSARSSVCLVALLLASRSGLAQAPWPTDGHRISAGSSSDRWMTDLCARPLGVPISVRPFSQTLLDSLLTACTVSGSASDMATQAWVTVTGNSARAAIPRGGPVWAGRGVTIAASGGVVGSWRMIHYSAQPVVAWSQNLAYEPSRSIALAADDFSDPWFLAIDRPYRFGDDALWKLDPGESFIRADSRWVAAGLSSAAQMWGPARSEPLVLGNTAGGFPHVFLESGLPVNIGAGRLSARWVAGLLSSSSFMTPPGNRRRVAVGAVASFVPRGFEVLEVGGTRFFHTYDEAGARDLSVLLRPFSSLLNASGLGGLETTRTFNQLASLFVRIAPRQSRIEAFGEFFREDNSADFRDLLVEMDHQTAYLIGTRVNWKGPERVSVLSIEAINGRITHLKRVRSQPALHQHSAVPEGHTHRGLPLGSPSLPGGGMWSVRWDRIQPTREWGVFAEVRRLAQNDEGGTWNGKPTGTYSLGTRVEDRRRASRRALDVAIEPGFGDVRGTNLSVSLRVAR
jgi:hypothetical protein